MLPDHLPCHWIREVEAGVRLEVIDPALEGKFERGGFVLPAFACHQLHRSPIEPEVRQEFLLPVQNRR